MKSINLIRTSKNLMFDFNCSLSYQKTYFEHVEEIVISTCKRNFNLCKKELQIKASSLIAFLFTENIIFKVEDEKVIRMH